MTTGAQSILGYHDPFDATSLSADEPCDTSRVYKLLNNLAFMSDVKPRYRVNVAMSTPIGATVKAGLTTAFFPWRAEFPWMIDTAGKPIGCDLRVAAKTATGTLIVRARLVAASAVDPSPDDTSAPDVWGYTSGTTSSSTTAWIIDEVIKPSALTNPRILDLSLVQVQDGGAKPSNAAWSMARLELDCDGSGMTAGTAFSICAIQCCEVTV